MENPQNHTIPNNVNSKKEIKLFKHTTHTTFYLTRCKIETETRAFSFSSLPSSYLATKLVGWKG